MEKRINYFRRLTDENDPASVKRFTVLAVLAHFIITGYVALFMDKSIANIALVTTIMEYNFYIILIGIFGLTVESVYNILLKKAEVMVTAAPPVTVQNADNVNTTSNSTKADTLNADNVETVNARQVNTNSQNSRED